MLDLGKMKRERKKDIRASLRFIDRIAGIIKSQPNRVWSKKQAKLLKSVYSSINKDWLKSKS